MLPEKSATVTRFTMRGRKGFCYPFALQEMGMDSLNSRLFDWAILLH